MHGDLKENMKELFDLTKRIKSGDVLTPEESERFLQLSGIAENFISGIENDYTSTCLSERYLNAKPWHIIADEMGQLTNDSVRKCCERAIKRYS